LVKASNRALKEVLANPDEGIATLLKVEPLLNGNIEKQRIAYALKNLMTSPENAEIGFGDLKDDRLARSVGVIVEAYELPRKPAVGEIFNRSFLPPKSERQIEAKVN
jgi:NitT/TauT family transport system substrate-binding protein